jgi:hypothetical protein
MPAAVTLRAKTAAVDDPPARSNATVWSATMMPARTDNRPVLTPSVRTASVLTASV